jgi:glucose/arabinose dehydrogenase
VWAAAAVALGTGPSPAPASTLPPSFQESVAFSGLTHPTVVRFASDGRVFVAEKSGLVKVFDSLSDPTPTVYADLRTQTQDYWDRGLLGLVLDPNFPATPYVYVLYTFDAAIGGAAPRWGDACPTPPGPTADGCVVSGRLSRLDASGNEQVLIEDWCQQYPSHSIGDLAFGPDGALYVSGGDGASFNFTDYGQDGNPLNPCGDPPVPVGGAQTPPTAEGGALRSQSVRRPPGEAVSLDGAILRVDPATGLAPFDNPLSGNPNPNAKRIIAYGLRNPFRIGFRPGTNELWVGDVGWDTWEEIERIPNVRDGTVENFGWPCFEGTGRQPGYDGANVNVCESLYSGGGAVSPFYTYQHSAKVVAGETCPTGSSSVSGMAFYGAGNYPSTYSGALFFADHSRNCIWAMRIGAGGNPDPATLQTFAAAAAGPVDVETGPGGDLFYVGYDDGTIRRISYLGSNRLPNAVATANPTSGTAPLTVQFDGSGSSDPDAGDTIAFAWDLDGDGLYDDSTVAKPSWTYTQPGTYTAKLQVTDNHGASAVSTPMTISASNTPPTPTIITPTSTVTWRVGNVISFSGTASDAQDGTLPASALTWTLLLQHCPSNCHTHTIQSWVGTGTGSFAAPDHDYPSYLELQLTATDSTGASTTTSVRLDPQTVVLSFASSPSGLQLVVGPASGTTPFTRTVIIGSTNSLSATTPQSIGGTSYEFVSWSDGGAQTHTISAPATATSYTATYKVATTPPAGLVAAYGFNEGANSTVTDVSGSGNNGTVSNTTWSTAGKFAGALSFNGTTSWVTVPDAGSLDLTNGMTLEAWVRPTALGAGWRTVIFKEQPGGIVYSLYGHQGTAPVGQVFVGGEQNAVGPAALPLNAWTHLAVTFDSTTLRLYVNGALAGSKAVAGSMAASTGVLRIGGNSVWPEYFAGLIDEVRVYNRALSATEIGSDMNTAVGGSPPPPDTTPPTVAITAPAAGATVSNNVDVTVNASDDRGVAGVQYKLDGANLGTEVTAPPYTFTWNTRTASNGSHTLSAVARDTSNNTAPSAGVDVTVSNTGPSPPPPGLVAAYGFNEGVNTTVADSSGSGNNGTVSNTTWSTAGKFGGALSFNGSTSWVTVPDANSLDLTNGMTLEAWVRPTALGTTWRCVIFKERPGGIVYSLYANEDTSKPIGQVYIGGEQNALGSATVPLNAWTHLAVTFDGTTLRLYVNGALAGSKAAAGSMAASTGVLRIGGNAIWPEFFAGLIDEVRVYNRALSATEIGADMNAPLP